MVRGSFMKGTKMSTMRDDLLDNVRKFNYNKMMLKLDTFRSKIGSLWIFMKLNSEKGITSGFIKETFLNISRKEMSQISNHFKSHGINLRTNKFDVCENGNMNITEFYYEIIEE